MTTPLAWPHASGTGAVTVTAAVPLRVVSAVLVARIE
jgi:hypothetical protein